MNMRFLYWAAKESGETINFMHDFLFEVGEVVDYKGERITILDVAVEDTVSCEELNMQMEDMRYYV